MPTTTATSGRIVLVGHANFEAWYSVLKRHCKTWGIWAYVDPEAEKLKEMTEPPDEPPNSNTGPVTLWKEKRKDYRALQEKLGKLEAYITETVDSKLLDTLSTHDTVAKQVVALYKLYNQSLVEKQFAARTEYEKFRKFNPKRSNLEDWCNDFLLAYTNAKKFKVPAAEGFAPQRDLLVAFNQVNTGYTSVLHTQVAQAEKKYVKDLLNPAAPSALSTPTLHNTSSQITPTHPTIPEEVTVPTLISDFLQASYLHEKPSRVHGTALATTLNGEESPYRNQRKRNFSKVNDNKDRAPCPCGDGDSHNGYWGECPYICPMMQGKDFNKDPAKVKKVAQYADSNERRKELLLKVRKTSEAKHAKKPKHDHRQSTYIDAGEQISDSDRTDRHQAHAIHYSAFSNEGLPKCSLTHSWILDPGSDIHICNNAEEFVWKYPATEHDIILAGGSENNVSAWGEVDIELDTPSGKKRMILKNVALVTSFFTSLISLSRLISANIHFDSGRNCLYRLDNATNSTIANLTPFGGHWLAVSRDSPAPLAKSQQPFLAFTTRKHKRRSILPLPSRQLSGLEAHVLLGHPGQEPLEHLPDNVIGISSFRSAPPDKADCPQCSVNKATQIISRRSDRERGATRPFESLAIDIIALDAIAFNRDRYVFHAYDLVTKFNFVYTIPDRTKDTLTAAFRKLDAAIKREFNVSPTFVLLDGERGFGFEDTNSLVSHCTSEGIQLQLRASDTPEQAGHIERSGKTLIERSRSLKVSSNLPIQFANEIYRYAGYLINRTPTKSLDWKTPFQAAYGKQPSLAHLRIYGCRAYALRKKIPRTDKLSPRALIGYLVGLDSRNIFRIWIPKLTSRGHLGKVIRTRDVTFDEKSFYSTDEDTLLSGPQLREVVNSIEESESDETVASSSEEEQTASNENNTEAPSTTNVPSSTSLPDSDLQNISSSPVNPYPSPVSLDPKSRSATPLSRKRKYKTNKHLQEANIIGDGSKRPRKPPSANAVSLHWHTFVTSSRLNKTRIHRSQLPPEPRYWNDVLKLPEHHRQAFLTACRKELDTISRKNTYIRRRRQELDWNNLEVLPLMWVFKYKFDSDGFLLKYKARICVRGDLQTTAEETHAATLAVRIFRALMAIAAFFNLEIRQYDAVNAFTNACLPTPVYCQEPEGFQDGEHIWELQRALYGLKTSPLLWYKDLTNTLKSFGLTPVLDCNCLWKNDRIFVFFYVDDIITMAKPGHSNVLDEFERKLCKRYEITNLQDRKLQTFCGITSHRDRDTGQIWLSQQDYLETIFHRYPAPNPWTKPPITPLPLEELVPSTEPKNEVNKTRYAQIVGSIGFAAGATRPDVSKAHSKLAEFLICPSNKHLAAAYQCLAYLYHTKTLALHYSASTTGQSSHILHRSEPDFYGATDASYADHKATRKSSQGYIFFLFGGPIDWKATLQRCVTKSTTESELIGASFASTELIWWWRVLQEIGVQPDNEQLLFCDNTQTIRLLTAEAPKLSTTLRHVDIHHHWLREAVQNKTLDIAYIESKLQPADGLTKLLPRQRHTNWVSLLNFGTIPSQTQSSSTASPADSQLA